LTTKNIMKEKVYLDSTIPSFYYEERGATKNFIEVTRRWWDNESQNYDLWISDAVFQEISSGEYPGKEKILELIKKIPALQYSIDLEHIVAFYIDNFVMPKSLIGDAIHLAYASFYEMEYLLTWNCNHLANANKRKHIRVINGRLGLNTPEITTPLELFKEEKNDIE
jgi:predicted nucleic acid-binding protein